MQRYRHYGNSYSSSSSSAAPVEELHAEEEEEVYTEEEVCEELPVEEEEEEVLHTPAGGVCNEEEAPLMQEEVQPVAQEAEGKTAPVESKNGKRTEGGGGGGGGGGGPKYSMFTWFVVLALLGVWSSVAVVYFDIVDYDNVIARAKEFHMNFSEVLQGKLTAYDTDGDGDFDVEDAKVLLGLKTAKTPNVRDSAEEKTETSKASDETTNQQGAEPAEATTSQTLTEETTESGPAPALGDEVSGSQDVESEIQAAVPLPPPVDDDFVPDDPRDSAHPFENDVGIDTTGVLVEDPPPQETVEEAERYLTSSKFTQEAAEEAETPSEPAAEPQRESREAEREAEAEGEVTTEKQAEEKLKDKAKKKKPKLLNKFDKTIKAEIDAAEKLRKKGKAEEALKAFEALVQQFPQSPRARYGKAQSEDDMAEKLRSNDMLQRAINTYREAAELPDVTSDLLRAALKRRAERQQFLGRMRGSLMTLEKLVHIFPEDVSLKNDLGVAYLLLGDNKGAKKVYEEVLEVAPGNGFAKVHYGFILKSENKISESIPYLRGGLESGEPGTDDGRFYFHLGDALQRVGDNDNAYHWYELGHQRGHFASVWQRSLYNVDGLKAQPWWMPKETGYTDLVKVLERNWKMIRDEALAVMDQNTGLFLPEEENLREKGEWGQYTLWQQGRKVGNSCQGVPKTCSLLERFPEATGCKRGQIKFSVMQPGTHVWPHTGPTNCRLRMHLGLVIPKQGCRIRCTNQTREWEEGKVLIFDDSFEHEVWQDADSYRLIFIVDVWHPQLTQYQRQTLSPI
ncbi:aspartyl/asparaginyl beta-hydroxylase isoform X3 [Parambassis ranga]|uniref:Aspartyl/asparaginyl beta-hydroxylase isoform X3 n=1 Tax=Parambassis ranga TaxID=210632 RepID=A0A6P7KIJ7_9TELE|nr:aspartyl/asparaginyl beta-hydroxylase-like isoform X3 [Parambassis ranga]